MKLIGLKQTTFITHEGFNKVELRFDEVVSGSKIEIMGRKIPVSDPVQNVLIPSVEAETIVPVMLHLPDSSFVSYTYKLSKIEMSEVCIINYSEGSQQYFDYCITPQTDDTKAVSEILEEYPDFRYASFNATAPLDKYITNGQYDLLLDISNIPTHNLTSEELAFLLENELEKASKHNTAPSTAIISKVSGLSRASIPYLSDAGIKYVIISRDKFRNETSEFATDIFKLCFGDSKVLVYINDNKNIIPKNSESSITLGVKSRYVEAKLALNNDIIEKSEKAVQELLTTKNIVPIFVGDKPSVALKAYCDLMSSKWKYPIFSINTPTEFIKKIEKATPNIPEIYGDIHTPNSDDITAIPNVCALNREFSRTLPIANALSLCKALESKENEYPESSFDFAMDGLIEFHKTSIPFSDNGPVETHKFNCFYKNYRRNDFTKALISDTVNGFCDRKAENFVSVFNPLPYARKTNLILNKPIENVLCQKSGNLYITDEIELPSFGSKSFIETEYMESAGFAKVSSHSIETENYKVSFDSQTGTIKSIMDLKSMRELIDSTSEYSFADFIYTSGNGDEIKLNVQKSISFEIQNGPIFVSIKRFGFEEQSCAEVTSTVTFYKNSERIDVKLSFENAKTLIGDFYDRYNKNIFYSIPLKCEDYHFITNQAIGNTNESIDKIPISANDFTVCNNFVAVENEYYGTAVTSKTNSVFHLGKIQYGTFSSKYNSTTSNIFLYAVSNRANQLVFDSVDDCFGTFELAIIPYRGKLNDEVYEKCENYLYTPMVTSGYSVERSRLSFSEKGVNFGSLKPIDDSTFLLRISEVYGRKRKITITLPFNISSAFLTNLRKQKLDDIAEISKNKIIVTLKANSPMSIVLKTERTYNISKNDMPKTLFYTYTSHLGRIVAVWENFGDVTKTYYEILCDGEVIETIKAQNIKTQVYMTQIEGNHNITYR